MELSSVKLCPAVCKCVSSKQKDRMLKGNFIQPQFSGGINVINCLIDHRVLNQTNSLLLNGIYHCLVNLK